MKILNSKPRQDNSVILFQKGLCQQTDKNQSFIELVLGAVNFNIKGNRIQQGFGRGGGEMLKL